MTYEEFLHPKIEETQSNQQFVIHFPFCQSGLWPTEQWQWNPPLVT